MMDGKKPIGKSDKRVVLGLSENSFILRISPVANLKKVGVGQLSNLNFKTKKMLGVVGISDTWEQLTNKKIKSKITAYMGLDYKLAYTSLGYTNVFDFGQDLKTIKTFDSYANSTSGGLESYKLRTNFGEGFDRTDKVVMLEETSENLPIVSDTYQSIRSNSIDLGGIKIEKLEKFQRYYPFTEKVNKNTGLKHKLNIFKKLLNIVESGSSVRTTRNKEDLFGASSYGLTNYIGEAAQSKPGMLDIWGGYDILDIEYGMSTEIDEDVDPHLGDYQLPDEFDHYDDDVLDDWEGLKIEEYFEKEGVVRDNEVLDLGLGENLVEASTVRGERVRRTLTELLKHKLKKYNAGNYGGFRNKK